MRSFLACALIAALPALAAGQSSTARDVAEIKAAMVAMWDAIEKGDVDRYATYVHPDSGTVEGKRFSSRGKSTRIFVREGGRWLCIHGHYTAVP